jgi:hypothetical protein
MHIMMQQMALPVAATTNYTIKQMSASRVYTIWEKSNLNIARRKIQSPKRRFD